MNTKIFEKNYRIIVVAVTVENFQETFTLNRFSIVKWFDLLQKGFWFEYDTRQILYKKANR